MTLKDYDKLSLIVLILLAIIETIIFCGRQELSLRVSGEIRLILHNNANVNDGNLELRFRVMSDDTVLKNRVDSGSGNAMYISPAIKNSLIQIGCEIIQKVNLACSFTDLADEKLPMLPIMYS